MQKGNITPDTQNNVPKKILESAYKCISEKGYAHASLRDIAEDAGVALSQLNYYFKNKEGLFTALVSTVSQNHIREVEDKLRWGTSSKERLHCLVTYFKALMHDRPEYIRLLLDIVSMSFWDQSYKDLLSSLFSNVSSLVKKYVFEDMAEKANSNEFSADARAKSLVGTIFGTAMQYILNPSDSTLLESLNCIYITT